MERPATRGPGNAISRRFAAAVVAWPWAVLAAVAAAATAAVLLLPGFGAAGAGLSGLVGRGNPAIEAQRAASNASASRC